jgi:hypothetical protein
MISLICRISKNIKGLIYKDRIKQVTRQQKIKDKGDNVSDMQDKQV